MVLTCGCEVTVTDPARITRACETHGRITLRDHFAGQALAGLLANPNVVAANPNCGWSLVNCDDAGLALVAYGHADAMLKAREAK